MNVIKINESEISIRISDVDIDSLKKKPPLIPVGKFLLLSKGKMKRIGARHLNRLKNIR